MNVRRVAAYAVVGCYVSAAVVGLLLTSAGGGHSQDPVEDMALFTAFGLFAGLGALLIARRPGHPMGPLFASAGLLLAIQVPTDALLAVIVIDRGGAPLWARLLGWPNTFAWYVVLAILVVYVPLLFPDGHLPSPRWRWVAWTVAAGLAVVCGLSAVSERMVLQARGPAGEELSVANPFGIAGMPHGEDNPLFDPVGAVVVVGAFAAVAAVVVRFRRSRGLERQQFKWFLFPVAMIAGSIVIDIVLPPIAGWVGVVELVNTVGFVGLPAAVTLAILRFRLYEIDRIISRTVTYTGVTAVLAAVYAAVAVVPATVLGASDRAGSGVSQLLVAAATLAAAGAFVPVRRRVQAVVDRRFNRARYDARRVVERFGAGLRDDVDLVRLTGDLRGVVASTVQPAHVSLWLRGDGAER